LGLIPYNPRAFRISTRRISTIDISAIPAYYVQNKKEIKIGQYSENLFICSKREIKKG